MSRRTTCELCQSAPVRFFLRAVGSHRNMRQQALCFDCAVGTGLVSRELVAKFGKAPTEDDERPSSIERLEKRMASAVREERYEDAAKIRDQINKLKETTDGTHSNGG